jgi:hypothetical protein
MIIQSNINFVKGINTPTVSETFFNSTSDTLTLQIDGDFTSGKFHLEGRVHDGGEWISLAGINLADFSVQKGGFTKAGLYELSIVSARALRARVESVEGGKVTIFGQVISTEEV